VRHFFGREAGGWRSNRQEIFAKRDEEFAPSWIALDPIRVIRGTRKISSPASQNFS